MASNVVPFRPALFTPEDVASFHREAAGWLRRGLADTVRRVRAADADVLLVMGDDGSGEPLWGIEKRGDQD